jgi:hypothetical protein
MKTKFSPVAFVSMLAVAAVAQGTPQPVNSLLDPPIAPGSPDPYTLPKR